MVGSEVDDGRLRPQSAELLGTEATMVEIDATPPAHRQADLGRGGYKRPSHRGEVGVALTDVVEKGRSDQLGSASRPSTGRITMSLIRLALSEKRSVPTTKGRCHPIPLALREVGRGNDPKEPADEMSPRTDPGQEASFDLQSMQRVASGRASSRAAPISRPQFSQIPYLPLSILARATFTSSS